MRARYRPARPDSARLSSEHLRAQGRDLRHAPPGVELTTDRDLLVEVVHVGGNVGHAGIHGESTLGVKCEEVASQLWRRHANSSMCFPNNMATASAKERSSKRRLAGVGRFGPSPAEVRLAVLRRRTRAHSAA